MNCKSNNLLQLVKKLVQALLYTDYIEQRQMNKLKVYKDF